MNNIFSIVYEELKKLVGFLFKAFGNLVKDLGIKAWHILVAFAIGCLYKLGIKAMDNGYEYSTSVDKGKSFGLKLSPFKKPER